MWVPSELFEFPTRQADPHIKDFQVCPLQRKSSVALQNVQWTIVKQCSILASIAVDITFNKKPPSSLFSSFFFLIQNFDSLFLKHKIGGFSRELAANVLFYFSCKHSTHLRPSIELNMELCLANLKGHRFYSAFLAVICVWYRYP